MGTFIYALVVLIFLCHDITADEECVITVKQGILRGEKRISAYNKTYCAFFGIPYGKPPVGESRFKLAEQADDWNGIYDATKEKPSCPQIAIVTHEYTGEEDCLYLNVYTNQLRNGNGERKATLVSIHGGAFLSGSASINKYGPDFFLNDDVILVTIQYRLGILDQSLALRWVHENIEYFGGDANNVTLIGESAGAASAHYHLLSNMSKGENSHFIKNSLSRQILTYPYT
ncbi:Acetylcholinesterase [Blattella germanica]|nr:Acetylcholinesterase [Blattella germanica]